MKLAILTATWKRPEITERVLKYYTEYCPAAFRVAVCSTIKERGLIRDCGWDSVLHKNEPLSNKWQAGMDKVREYEPDAVLTVGSDDLVSMQHIDEALRLVPEFEFVDASIGFLYDVNTEEFYMVDYTKVAHGGGRIYNAALLQEADWQVWAPEFQRGLDGVALRTIMEQTGRNKLFRKRTNPKDKDGRMTRIALQLKSDVNVWSMEMMKAHANWVIPAPRLKKLVFSTIGKKWIVG